MNGNSNLKDFSATALRPSGRNDSGVGVWGSLRGRTDKINGLAFVRRIVGNAEDGDNRQQATVSGFFCRLKQV